MGAQPSQQLIASCDPARGERAVHQAGREAAAPLAPSLGDSIATLRDLARDLAQVPEELREAPARAAHRPAPGLPGGERGVLPRVLAALAWPLTAVALSVGAAVGIVFLANG
jgi:hypothetical protein